MKKITKLIAPFVCVLTMFSCAETSAEQPQSEAERTAEAAIDFDTEPIPYKSVIPEEKIVKGEENAINTISGKLGKAVQYDEGTDTVYGTILESAVYTNEDKSVRYNYFRVDDVDEGERTIIFLFSDDTEAVIPVETDVSFVAEDKLYPEWHDKKYQSEENYNSKGVFSWHSDGAAQALFTEDSGTLTSVWAYDPSTGKAGSIWVDYINCPIWSDVEFDE